MIRIAVLTSSRADFGVYLPLLKAMNADSYFKIEIVAFGTHLSKFHGYTIEDIEREGFKVEYRIVSMLLHDDPESIASAYALTALKFAAFWSEHQNDFDWTLCLGDRYEMAAAVAAGIPLNIRFAHLYGGETTLGAVDNIYRHTITISSKLHFVSLDAYAKRVKEIAGADSNCIVVGSLSLDNLDQLQLLSEGDFQRQWNIDLGKPSILITVHPETVDYKNNQCFADELLKALLILAADYQLIITMPNADTSGAIFRIMFNELKHKVLNKVHLIENFGTQSYFSCMKYADFLLGNTSSGIVEAAIFNKYVINIGDRQKGRLTSDNIINVPFNGELILKEATKLKGKIFTGNNIFDKGNASKQIIQTFKELEN